MTNMRSFIKQLPKAEIHMHLGGTIEPETAFAMAQKNNIPLRFKTIEELRAAYRFKDLQSFLDLLFEIDQVLVEEEDFYEITMDYLRRAREDFVLHAEVFFEPQVHMDFGVPLEAMMNGVIRALEDGGRKFGMMTRLIVCFMRNLSEEYALDLLEQLMPYRDRIHGFGLSSTEVGNPPQKFERAFKRCRELGFFVVAHAGEEGPPAYVYDSLDLLKVNRIDHGVRSIEDPALVKRLAEEKVPLAMTPLSNIMLCVFADMKQHSIKALMDEGVIVSISSDDPAYFGGYVNNNYVAVQEAFGLSQDEVVRLAKYSFESSFLNESEKADYIRLVDEYVASFQESR